MSSDSAFKVVLSTLVTICLGLSAWALKSSVDLQKHQAVIDYKVTQILQQTEDERKQNSTLAKHWKLHGWSRDQINELRYAAGKGTAHWPND